MRSKKINKDDGTMSAYDEYAILCGGSLKRHRKYGPAVSRTWDGLIMWYHNGYIYRDVREFCKAHSYSKQETLIMVLKYGDTLPMFMRDL